MTRFLSLYRAGVFVPLLLICTSLHAQTIITFDPPNSTYTIASAINLTGEITGYYSDGIGPQHGFLRKRDGTLITFDVELHGIFPSNASPVDINAAGQITGYYRVEAIVFGSFLRQADGTIVEIGPIFNQDQTPHDTARTSSAATSQGPRPFCPIDGSAALGINDIGQITGGYNNFMCFGFLQRPDGTVTSFDVRSESHPEDSPDTEPQAVNLFGQITGFYSDINGRRGFLRQPNGGIVRFDPTNSISTIPMAINLLGQITGYYVDDTSFVVHSFLRQPNGTIITFDPAGSTDTEAKSINLEGEITGFYLGADGAYHGFLREHDGSFTTFDAPGSQGTFPQSINLFGQITGYYFDAIGFHGFVRDR